MPVISDARRSILFWSLFAVLFEAIIVGLYFFFPEAYNWLGAEDELGENMTSVFYFFSGFLILGASILQLKTRSISGRRVILPVLLAFFFIFVGGEEISWGQRLFGLNTPEAIRQRNVQGEMTLHNLDFFDRNSAILNQHTALNAFALLMGVVIPLGYRFIGWVKSLLDRLNFPVIPVALSMWFVVGLAHGMTIAKIDLHWTHAEIKELVFSIGFFLFGWEYFSRTRQAVKVKAGK